MGTTGVRLSHVLVETVCQCFISLNLCGMLMKSNLILTGLKMLENAIELRVWKIDWRKAVSVHRRMYHSKELELCRV